MIRWFDLVRWLPIVGGSKGGREDSTSSTHLTKQSTLNIASSSSFTKQKQAAKYKMNQQRQKCI